MTKGLADRGGHPVAAGNSARRPRTTLQTAARALRFLEVVASADVSPTLKEVASSLGVNITTCYHLFNTLEESGYVVRARDGGLEIGGRVAPLYRALTRRLEANRGIFPMVGELSALTEETAYFSAVTADGVMVQEVVEGKQAVRVAGLYVGYMGAEHLRASGKAVLAFLDEEARLRILSTSTAGADESAVGSVAAELETEFVRIRKDGWAIDEQEFASKVCCVSAPVFGVGGGVVGSLAVSAPADRFSGERERIIRAVCETGERASRMLGGREDP